MLQYIGMNARDIDHFPPSTPDTKGIEVREATLGEYNEAREKREVDKNVDGSVITIRDVEETRRMEERIHVLSKLIKSTNVSSADNTKPVTENNFTHQQGLIGIKSESDKEGLFKKIKKFFQKNKTAA